MTRARLKLASLLLLALAPAITRAADILQEVPRDALGFVVLHNLSGVDAKVAQLSTQLDRGLPRPLAFLKELTGISDGLNPNGDFLLAFIRSVDANASHPEFCVYLPVADYDRFIQSLNGTTVDGISVATVGGEDLLIAHRGDWAVVMNPDARARITQLLDASPTTLAQIAEWQKWIESNDATIVVLAAGVKPALKWALGQPAVERKIDEDSENDIFGSDDVNGPLNPFVAPRLNRSPADAYSLLQDELRKWAAASPDLSRALSKSIGIGCGIRLDKDGNAVGSLRIATSKDIAKVGEDKNGATDLPFSIYGGGGFVMNGAAMLKNAPRGAIGWALVRRMLLDLEADEQLVFNKESLRRLEQAVKEASADVQSAVVLTQPGGDSAAPVYSNEFLVLRVSSTAKFMPRAAEVMRLWNVTNRDAKGETHLVFDVEEVKFGERTATQYSLDMVEIAGGDGLPEIRLTMEKMFGPKGVFRLWFVPVDEQTALLAAATTEQVTSALKALDRKQPVEWTASEYADASRPLPPNSEWRFFFSPHRYYEWLRRESTLIIGVPVIGGPLVKEYPASPPIGLAGGLRNRELWLDIAAPAETIKSAGAALKIKKAARQK